MNGNLDPALLKLAREVIERDLGDPLWPGLTEDDWARDAQLLAGALLDINGSLVPLPESRNESYSARLRREGGMAVSGKFAEDDWKGVYPGMCVDPEVCRGKSCCPRDYSCCE